MSSLLCAQTHSVTSMKINQFIYIKFVLSIVVWLTTSITILIATLHPYKQTLKSLNVTISLVNLILGNWNEHFSLVQSLNGYDIIVQYNMIVSSLYVWIPIKINKDQYQYADQVFKVFIRKLFRSMLGDRRRVVSYSMKRRVWAMNTENYISLCSLVWVRRADKKCEKRRNMSVRKFRPISECSWRKKKP